MDLLVHDWSSLPAHILDSVVERLLLPDDYIRFRSVCTLWHAVAQDNKAKRATMTAPLLLFYTGKRSTWGLYDVTENKVLPRQVRLPNHRYCGSSPTGWLVYIDKYYQVTLVNPFLRVKGSRKNDNSIIHLPLLYPYDGINNRKAGFHLYKALISADPLVNPKDCVVMAIREPWLELTFFRLGTDSQWNFFLHETFPTGIPGHLMRDITYSENKFYALDRWSNLVSFLVKSTGGIEDVQVVADKGGDKDAVCYFKYLVKVNEKDIVMVNRYTEGEFDSKDHYKSKTLGFKLFKLNSEKSEWVQIDDLGEMAVFVGHNSTVGTLGLEWSGCRPNCIYFSHGWDRICIDSMQDGYHDFGVYDVKNQTFSETCGSVAKNLVKVMKRPPIWVMPPTLKL